ncbi:MAG: LacI family transcriptional regulator, partial [bacterium]
IRQPIERMIDSSVNDLLDRIKHDTMTPKQELVAGDLVVRSSARLPSGLSSGWVISTSETRNV